MIEDLVNFCSRNYSRVTRCPKCRNDCQGGCEKCLDAIHFSRITRVYNCNNIALFYACKYIYKYSSEIDRLFSLLRSLRAYPSFDILSIGCGPCTELIGIVRNIDKCKYNKKINYVGFDMNEVWRPIHKFYMQNNSARAKISLRYFYQDACKTQLMNSWRPNLLVLQYVISDMVKSGIDVKKFLDDLMNNIISQMSPGSFIILNDINHNKKARDYFDYLEKIFKKRYESYICKGHFKNNNKFAYSYGNLHSSNKLTCIIPKAIKEQFNPWEFCSSAYLIIRKDS